MSRFRLVAVLAAALTFAACSETDSPSSPSAPSDNETLTLQLDESADMAAADEESGADLSVVPTGNADSGKASANPQFIACIENRVHVLCLDIRNSRIRASSARATATKFANRTRGVLKVNGFTVVRSGNFGPIFRGDDLFADFTLNYRVFRGDRVCSTFPGATTQVCGTLN